MITPEQLVKIDEQLFGRNFTVHLVTVKTELYQIILDIGFQNIDLLIEKINAVKGQDYILKTFYESGDSNLNRLEEVYRIALKREFNDKVKGYIE